MRWKSQTLVWAQTVAATVALAVTVSTANAEKAPRRAAPEVAVGGITVEEHAAQQIKLNAELVGQMPKGVLGTPIRIELTDQDRADLAAPAISGVPPVVGVVKTISPGIGAVRGQDFKGGVIQETEAGGFVWAVTLTSPGAQAIRVHFKNFSLPPGAEMYFFSVNGQAHGPYTWQGRNGNGDFWTRSIASDTGVVQLHFTEANRQQISFTVTHLGHIQGRGLGSVEKSHDTWPCYDNVLCLIDAMCTSGTPADPAKDAVAKMEWIIMPYIYTCTGGLLADTDPGTQIPYFLTANHCFDTDISNLETFFWYTTDSCNGVCPDSLVHGGTPPPPSTIGVTVQATGASGDFTLATLDEDPPGGVTFLGWNNTAIAFTNGAPLYRISNANFGPQVYADYEVDTSSPTCGGIPRGAWIYSTNIQGSTMGGSSGSPVLNSASEVVGQLTGCCGYNCANDCDFVNNWTIDGAMAYYWDSVAPFLDPEVECTENWQCDDGQYCNGAEWCDLGTNKCQPGTPPNCNDGVGCTDDSCNEGTNQCDNIANDAYCDDSNPCTDDYCDAVLDCQYVPNDANSCDDGEYCNGAETCSGGVCQPGTDPCPGQGCDEVNDVCVPVDCDNDGICEPGEDCNNCPNDCRSKTNGKPSGQYCCDGDLPDCGDPRCHEDGWMCADSICTIDEDCDDGQWCNGAETCVSGSCQAGTDPCPGQGCDEVNDVCVPCGAKGDPCATGADCCSGSCHPIKLTCK